MQAELLDRYVREVGRRLPRRQRADVETELHSLLMDALVDRVEGQEAEAAPEAEQVAVLEEFGPPAKVAAQYMPTNRYLIGPRVYDTYLVVIAAVGGSITLAHLLLFALALWAREPVTWQGEVIATAGDVFGRFFGALLAGLGSVTLSFAILERVLPASAFEEEKEQAWDPRALPPLEDRAQIEVGGLIIEIVFSAIALILFVFFPQWIGVGFVGSIDGGPRTWHWVPLLSEHFVRVYVPMLAVLWVADAGLKVVLLRQGRWQRLPRLADFCLTVGKAFVQSRMAFGPPILTFAAIQAAGLRELLESFVPTLVKVGLILGLIGLIVEAGRKLYQVFRTWPAQMGYRRDFHRSAER